MSLLDIFKFKEKKPKMNFNEIGNPGTEMFSGYITEEFNSDLRDREGRVIYDTMRRNDAQVFSSLQIIKLPLLSAKWYVQAAEDDEMDDDLENEQKEFIEDLIFEKLKWKKQLKLILTYLDFGFKYLEKVFGMDEDGRIVWKKWGDRIQLAHEKWGDDNGNQGAQQQVLVSSVAAQPFIPMEKLILFSYRREGDNYNGISLLRTAYKHWWFKDTLYKIQGIQAERYGVGLPWIKMGENNSADDRNKAEEMGKNLRSNETSFWVTPSDWEAEILTPNSNVQGASIEKAIDHHNRMILVNVLAQFMDLGSDATGSFALSKEQGSFFLLCLQSIADEICEEINEAIKELILINWPDTKKFPKLQVTDIANPDFESLANVVNTLTAAGYLRPDIPIKKYVRDVLKFPEMTKEEEEEEPEEEPSNVPVVNPKEVEEELKKEPVKKDEKKKLTDKIIISQKEEQFKKDVEDNELIIGSIYKEFESELVEAEARIKKFLIRKVEKTSKRMINGVECLRRSFTLVNEIKSGINDIMKKLERKISGGSLSGKMMKNVAKNAIVSSTKLENTKDFASTLIIAEPEIRSFMGGHISNMHGVVFNEGRQTFEKMQANVSQEVSVRLTKKQIEEIRFNRNIYKLSVMAHPRGLFRSIIASDAKRRGVNHFKMILPEAAEKEIAPSGNIAKWLFLILTVQQWNERTGTKNNIDTVGGLGAHHNSLEYYYPVEEDDLEEELRIAREQRAEFNKTL